MANFRYRAATAAGVVRTGILEGASLDDARAQLRRQGLLPIQTLQVSQAGKPARPMRGGLSQAGINALGELGVLLEAGLTLDRALTVCVGNISDAGVRSAFERLSAQVKEGASLSHAMADSGTAFPPMASAMCAAGEADGRLGIALSRLAENLDRAYALRQSVISSLIYPALLVVVATGVILAMLLIVVPQFEGLFTGARTHLPLVTRLVMGVSEAVRTWGWLAVLVIVAVVVGVRWRLRAPGARDGLDRVVLTFPLIGNLVRDAQTAGFARTLGALVEGGVALPDALAIAQRTVSNNHMAVAIGKVVVGLRQGGGLSAPLAASGVFPAMAISFLRTGEETAQLGRMLIRLADILDRQVRSTTSRLIAILTPAITVIMGAVVATVIASLMSAILGFNDLALAP